MNIKFGEWKQTTELPEEDGTYAVAASGCLPYLALMTYTTDFGWNTSRTSNANPINFEDYDRKYYWAEFIMEDNND